MVVVDRWTSMPRHWEAACLSGVVRMRLQALCLKLMNCGVRLADKLKVESLPQPLRQPGAIPARHQQGYSLLRQPCNSHPFSGKNQSYNSPQLSEIRKNSCSSDRSFVSS